MMNTDSNISAWILIGKNIVFMSKICMNFFFPKL